MMLIDGAVGCPKLPAMPASRLALRQIATLALVATACGRDVPAVARESTAVRQAVDPEPAATAPAPSGWLPAFGPVLLVMGDTAAEAIVVPGDSTGDAGAWAPEALAGRTVHLLDRGGEVAAVTARPEQPPEPRVDCLGRPVLHLDLPQPAGGRAWTAGLFGGALSAIAFDSLSGLAPRDSAALAASIARLASSLPVRDQSFAGLPFTVVDAQRFTAGDARVLVAYVVRRVNREANPLQERTLLIAEADPSGQWNVAWHERSTGSEDEIEGNELLGGFLLQGHPWLLVARDASAGVSWSLLERSAPAQWRVRWTGGGGVC
jgi:hypothetical protein